jgi:hypothetical protein
MVARLDDRPRDDVVRTHRLTPIPCASHLCLSDLHAGAGIHHSVARTALALGKVEPAQFQHAQASDTFKALRDAEDLGSQIDWAAALSLGAEIAQAMGDTQAMAMMQDELATLELGMRPANPSP